VSAVDADGNEVGGIVLPSSRRRWRRTRGGTCATPTSRRAQLLVFAAHAAVREDAAGAPNRPAIRDRPSPSATRRARIPGARPLRRNGRSVKDGYLLDEDVETSLTFAARMWDAWA